MRSKPEACTECYEPLCRIIMIPLDASAIVRRKLVVEIVVTFANGNESSDKMVFGRMLIIERRVSKPMG